MLTGTYNVSNGNLTVIIDNEPFTIDRYHPNYESLKEAWKNNDRDLFVKLYYQETSKQTQELSEYVAGTDIVINGDKIYYKDRELHNSMVDRILYNKKHGFPIDYMIKFLENLLSNPSSRSIQEAPDFLIHRNMPITVDGCFLAYKTVQSDWFSKTAGDIVLLSGTVKDGRVYNGIGEVIKCERNQVDDDRSHECSKGLHVGALAYAGPGGSFNRKGDRVIIVKVNPRDIVSVPRDHSAQKLRVCEYEVIKEFVKPMPSSAVGERLVEPVKTRKLQALDIIKFDYPHSEENMRKRHCVVDDLDDNVVYTTLLEDDPSYEDGNEFRNFKLEKMSNIEFLETNDDFEDYEDYDDDFEYDDDL